VTADLAVRWIGNEKGIAGATNWAFLRENEVYPGSSNYKMLTEGNPDGNIWVAGEADVSIRPGWFYHSSEDTKVKNVNQLVELYYQSVGHNAVLMLNFPPNREGLISKTRFHQRHSCSSADSARTWTQLVCQFETKDINRTR
jgi:alpha-L-fucosidase